MKGLQILASLLLIVAFCKADDSSEEEIKKWHEISKECAAEQGLTEEDTRKVPRLICSGQELDKKLSCQAACFYKKLEAMQNDESFGNAIKKLMENTDEEKAAEVEAALDKCNNEITNIEDQCDKAAAFTKCLLIETKYCEKLETS